ncbi:MAG: hypothetical protein WC326_09615 [Candidatus Delongbacteria bacterium]
MSHSQGLCVLGAALALGGWLLAGCGDHEGSAPPTGSFSQVRVTPGQTCTSLLAGQTIPAGEVCVEVIDEGDQPFLAITYTTTDGWLLLETHAWVGLDLADLPATGSGNPRVGHFPYCASGLGGLTRHTLFVDLSLFGSEHGSPDLCELTFLAATHAVVGRDDNCDGRFERTETAWGAGPRLVERGNWATWFSFVMECCEPAFDGSEYSLQVDGLNASGQARIQASAPGEDLQSYFTARLDLDGDGSLDGDDLEVPAWCLDHIRNFTAGTDWHAAIFYSSLIDLSGLEDLQHNPLLDRWQNLDLVNWILNQGFVGRESSLGNGPFTYGDLQVAIWTLVESDLTGSLGGLGAWSQARVDEILSEVPDSLGVDLARVDYLPPCPGLMSVVVTPRVIIPNPDPDKPSLGGYVQPLLLVLPSPCSSCE